MQTRQSRLLFVFACLALFCASVGFLIQTRRPGPCVTIIRQTIDQDRRVVFFRLEGVGNYSIFKVSRNETGLPDYAFVEVKPDAFIPVGPGSPANEFGIVAPTGRRVWKVSVELRKEANHSWKQGTEILSCWKSFLKANPKAALRTITLIWNNPIPEFQTVDSQVITNEPLSRLNELADPCSIQLSILW